MFSLGCLLVSGGAGGAGGGGGNRNELSAVNSGYTGSEEEGQPETYQDTTNDSNYDSYVHGKPW